MSHQLRQSGRSRKRLERLDEQEALADEIDPESGGVASRKRIKLAPPPPEAAAASAATASSSRDLRAAPESASTAPALSPEEQEAADLALARELQATFDAEMKELESGPAPELLRDVPLFSHGHHHHNGYCCPHHHHHHHHGGWAGGDDEEEDEGDYSEDEDHGGDYDDPHELRDLMMESMLMTHMQPLMQLSQPLTRMPNVERVMMGLAQRGRLDRESADRVRELMPVIRNAVEDSGLGGALQRNLAQMTLMREFDRAREQGLLRRQPYARMAMQEAIELQDHLQIAMSGNMMQLPGFGQMMQLMFNGGEDVERSGAGALAEKLPVSIFRELLAKQDASVAFERDSCAICLTEFEAEDKVCEMLPCRHLFHDAELKQWLETSEKCPVCNAIIMSSEKQ